MMFSGYSELLMEICRDIVNRGGRVFYTGGMVRDYILDCRDIKKDIDLDIFNLSRSEVIEVLRDYGEVKIVGKSFPIIKLKGHTEWDFSIPQRPTADFADACKRRDFTINSMLMDVFTGEIIDIYDGQKDLKNKVIKHTGENVFNEDGLRVYRAAELAARLSFSVHPDTIVLMQLAEVSNINRERIYKEIKKILLLSRRPSTGLRILDKCGIIKVMHPLLYNLIGCIQSVQSHPEGDVWEHTLLVVDQAAMLRGKSIDAEILMFSALLHDIGKPLVTREINDRVTAYGHEIEGARLACSFLSEMNTGNRVIKGVEELVREHMQPILMFKQKDIITDKAIRRLVNRVNVEELMLLSQADFNGRGITRDYEAVRGWLMGKIEQLGLKPDQKIQPLIRGRDLLILGFEPGKEYGRILDYAGELQMEGLNKEEILREIIAVFS